MGNPEPFFFFSKGFIDVLEKLKISVVYSTYQAGRLIFISSLDGKSLYKFAKNFKRPMGIDVTKDIMTIASNNYVEVYSRSPKLAKAFPGQQGFYDDLFVLQSKYYTGRTDMHEIVIDNGEIWAANTAFSCVSKMSNKVHFEPVWKPDFISELEPDDRCHLNGLIMENGEPAYVTFFRKSNETNGWRGPSYDTGMLWDIKQGKAILENLPMPHSPILVGDDIYFLLSATGEVVRYNRISGKSETIFQIDGFLRGLDIYDNYLFIGSSKMRSTSKTFGSLPISKNAFCGVAIVDLRTNELAGRIVYTDKINELFSLKVIPNVTRPLLFTEMDEEHSLNINCGEELNYWLVKNEEEQSA